MISPISIYFEKCEPNWSLPSHPANNHILVIVKEGTFTYTVDGTPYTMRRGDMVYVPEGTMRSGKNGPQDPHHMYAAHFRYEGDGDRLRLLRERRPMMVRSVHGEYFIRRFALLTQQWLRKEPYCETICHSIVLELLAMMNSDAESTRHPTKTVALVKQIQDIIVNRYSETIEISELADLLQRTPNYISSVFRQVTGQTITEYTQQLRVTAARDLLINTQMTIGEISLHVGFCEQSYFTQVFKKFMGVSPSAYLKEQMKIAHSSPKS